MVKHCWLHVEYGHINSNWWATVHDYSAQTHISTCSFYFSTLFSIENKLLNEKKYKNHTSCYDSNRNCKRRKWTDLQHTIAHMWLAATTSISSSSTHKTGSLTHFLCLRSLFFSSITFKMTIQPHRCCSQS